LPVTAKSTARKPAVRLSVVIKLGICFILIQSCTVSVFVNYERTKIIIIFLISTSLLPFKNRKDRRAFICQ
jgi:hypothetical protein